MILIFYGGFIAAVIFLILASAFQSSPNAVRSLSLLAFFALIYQGGCMAVATDIGRATGGGGSVDDLLVIIAVAFLIACVWSFALGERPIKNVAQARWQTRERQSPPRLISAWVEPALLLSACILALSFLMLWPLARRDVNTRRWFLLSELGLIVILYVISCRFLCRNRFLALIGMIAASFAFIYCISQMDS